MSLWYPWVHDCYPTVWGQVRNKERSREERGETAPWRRWCLSCPLEGWVGLEGLIDYLPLLQFSSFLNLKPQSWPLSPDFENHWDYLSRHRFSYNTDSFPSDVPLPVIWNPCGMYVRELRAVEGLIKRDRNPAEFCPHRTWLTWAVLRARVSE